MATLPAWSMGLVFGTEDGQFHEEPWQGRAATLANALQLARRDGLAGRFGRTFQGFSRAGSRAELYEALVLHPLPSSRVDPSLPADRLQQLVESRGDRFDGEVAAEPVRHPVALDGLELTHWWRFECAFGPATRVGIELGRCSAVDQDEAREAANFVGHAIAHQGSLYPVTAVALPFIVTLLEAPIDSCRDVLAEWLAVVIDSAAESRAPRGLRAATDLVASTLGGVWPFGKHDLRKSLTRELTTARDVRAALRTLGPRLRALIST